MSQALITRHNNGGYSKGDTIEIDKLQPVYEDKLEYRDFTYLGEGTFSNNVFVSPDSNIIYEFEASGYRSDPAGNVYVKKSTGETIATLNTKYTLGSGVGFDDDNNFYAVVYDGSVSGNYVIKITSSGICTVIYNSSSVFHGNIAYGSIYIGTSSYNFDTGSSIRRYSFSGNLISDIYDLKDEDSDITFEIYTICGENSDDTNSEPLYVGMETYSKPADKEYYIEYLAKISNTGRIIWQELADTGTICYCNGFIYYYYNHTIPDSYKIIERVSSDGTKDSNYKVNAPWNPIMELSDIIYNKQYICCYGKKGFVLIDAETGEIKYSSTLYFANKNGEAFYNGDGHIYKVTPPTSGYKVLK